MRNLQSHMGEDYRPIFTSGSPHKNYDGLKEAGKFGGTGIIAPMRLVEELEQSRPEKRLMMMGGGEVIKYEEDGPAKGKMPANFAGRTRGRDADTPYNDQVALDAGVEIDYSDRYRYLTEDEKELALELESKGLLRIDGKAGGYITPQSMANLMTPKARLAMAAMSRQIRKGEEPGGQSFGRGRIESGGVAGAQRATRPALIKLAAPRGYEEEEQEPSRAIDYAAISSDGPIRAETRSRVGGGTFISPLSFKGFDY